MNDDKPEVTLITPPVEGTYPAEPDYEYGPVVLVHTQNNTHALGEDNPGHCFGPFLTVGEALMFVGEMAEIAEKDGEADHCIKTVIPLKPPNGTVVLPFPAPDGEAIERIIGKVSERIAQKIERREQARRDARN